ncbi:MAG: UDP-N-acetylglucosamine 1-carboxyvinyltransferase, partial [bacterium]
RSGCTLETGKDWIDIVAPERLQAVGLCTGPYPAFATDHQPLWMACLTTADAPDGYEVILETLFESRFNQVEPLQQMGADIEILSQVACIRPVPSLQGTRIAATDIRGGMGLVVAALRTNSTTEITALHHLRRGYEHLEAKLGALGAEVSFRHADLLPAAAVVPA